MSQVFIYPVTGASGCLFRVVRWYGTEGGVWALLDNQVCREDTHYAGTGDSWKLFGIWVRDNVSL